MSLFADEPGFNMESTTQLAEMMYRGPDKATAQDDKLIARFYMGTIRNDGKSILAGRPVYDDIEKIRILKPGERDYLDRGATDGYRQRFSKQYAAFKSGEEEKVSGTPLSLWPVIRASQVAELAHFHVRTVEQLAEMPDIHLQKFMGGNGLREAARDFVKLAVSQAPLRAVQAELQGRDAKIAAMQAQMEQMSVIMAGLQAQHGLAGQPAQEIPPGTVPYRGPDFAPPPPFLMDSSGPPPSPISPAKRGRGRPPKAEPVTP